MRFCWRERTERVNWRLLRNLQLADVVRRGDATLLEPYALHLTFARLPVVVATLAPPTASRGDVVEDNGDDHHHTRSAWFIVRVFQLSMEYLLFLRARDGTVVDSLREELLVCERECELLVERAKKWKDRSRSGERQVEKLHQVLQSIAKLLQIEGATSNAVSTIETLLRDLVPSGRNPTKQPASSGTHVEEARVCALCGKMFSSQAYLDKHAVRRHPGVEMKTVNEEKKRRARPASTLVEEEVGNNQADAQMERANDMKGMLRAVEQTLQDHQATLRTVAQEEADKLHSLYQQLHVETQLAEDMRAKRMTIENQVEKHRQELEVIEQEKEDLADEIRSMKEQLQFLGMKKTMQAQSGGSSSSPVVPHDDTLRLELKRLEETVAMMKEALAAAREEVQRAHEVQGTLLKEKSALESQLHESRNHVLRLEASLRKEEDHVPTMRADVGIQATETMVSTMIQTDAIPSASATRIVEPPTALVPVAAGEAAVQTESLVRLKCTDTMMQTDPDEIPPQASVSRTQSATMTSIGVGVDADLVDEAEELDSVFKLKCASLLDLVQRRADTSARAASITRTEDSGDAKVFSSLSRRRYLRSRFLHDERTVTERISSHVTKLEQTSVRFGVSPKSSVLVNEHVEVVQRALHAHLEVLPSEVLQRMVDIERTVNSLIQKYWMPQEKSRQQALELLTVGLEAKSQANQGLVRQAMAAFAAGMSVDSSVNPTEPPAATVSALTEPDVEAVSRTEDADNCGKLQTIEEERSTHTVGSEGDETAKREPPLSVQSAPPVGMPKATSSVSEAVQQVSGPAMAANIYVKSALDSSPPASAFREQGEPSPASVQEVRRHATAVKVVSVSPKSSPPKSPPPRDQKNHENEKAATAHLWEGEIGLLTPSMEPRQTHMISPETASVTDSISPSVEPMQAPGTSGMPSRVPSSFSAKHPESQLGIVIPSRFESTAINVDVLRDNPELESSGGDFGHTRGDHALRWSSSASVSERSFSAVESSEMSFDASLPSLGSEGVGVSRSFPSSSTEQIPTISTETPDNKPLQAQDETLANATTAIQGIVLIQEEISHSEGDSDLQSATVVDVSVIPAPPQQPSPRQGPLPSDVMTFDGSDDSDIEEVMLV